MKVDLSVVLGIDLTNIREHLYTVLNRALLDWDQPVTVVDPEHCLKQLHKDWLPGLRGGYKKKVEWLQIIIFML